MGWQPEEGNGEEEESAAGSGVPGDPATSGGPARDPRLPGFALGGEWAACAPSAALAAALEATSGPDWRCPGAAADELLTLLRRWQALESWAAAGKLGVLRALIREDDLGLPGAPRHGDLPDGWSKSLTHEVALALAMPAVSAENLMWLAWNLQARLPGVGAMLAGGTLPLPQARAVDQALESLGEDDAAKAEAMILPELAGKTYGQAEGLAVQAATAVDPESVTRRRRYAERNKSRVAMFREQSGAAALSGRDLPTAETLAAHSRVSVRAEAYKESGSFPDILMDQLRAQAYLDLLNGISAEERIVSGLIMTVPESGDPENKNPENKNPENKNPDCGDSESGDPDSEVPDSDGEAHCMPSSPLSPPSSSSSSSPPAAFARTVPAMSPRLANLVLPLATLLGLAERPGESHGLGSLDPGLCRALATIAVASPDSTFCVTVVNSDGVAIGHGCARRARSRHAGYAGNDSGPGGPGFVALPSRVNLTIADTLLTRLASEANQSRANQSGPPGRWSFTRTGDPGPPAVDGIWRLTLPDGRELTVALEPVPTFDCDHRHESQAYKPNDKLRHLVQIRDGDCTFPTCSRHARESDFEHAVSYEKGGRTCACNAGARSRQCHRIKQSPGWNVTQPKPGFHEWTTPSGRTYRQGPKRYPA